MLYKGCHGGLPPKYLIREEATLCSYYAGTYGQQITTHSVCSAALGEGEAL